MADAAVYVDGSAAKYTFEAMWEATLTGLVETVSGSPVSDVLISGNIGCILIVSMSI